MRALVLIALLGLTGCMKLLGVFEMTSHDCKQMCAPNQVKEFSDYKCECSIDDHTLDGGAR